MRFTRPLVLVPVASLAILVTAVVTSRRVERGWAELLARAAAVEAEVRARPAERPVLSGEPGAGEAFAHYRRALALVCADERVGRVAPTLEQALAATPEERAAYAAGASAIAPILRELRRGARAGRAAPALDWEARSLEWDWGIDAVVVRGTPARRLGRIACAAATVELAEGRSGEALEILLDTLQFARDLTATPLVEESRVGARLLAWPWLVGFGEDGAWAMFTEEELDRWLDALAVVDRDLETVGPAIRVEAALTVRALAARVGGIPPGGRGKGPDPLRSALLRGMTHDAHVLLLDFAEAYAAAFEEEPRRGPGRVLAEYERLGRPHGPYATAALRRFGDATTERLRGLAELRLLRHALGKRTGRGDVPAEDRFGLPIRTETAGEIIERTFLDTDCPAPFSRLEVRLPRTSPAVRPSR